MGNNKHNLIRRLVLAKSLFLYGCKHSVNKDEISRMLAIHNFDHAVEIVLKCIAEKKKIKSKRKYYNFEELLNGIKKYPHFKTHIRGLHDQRNLVQHQGDIPDIEMVIKYKSYVEDFSREVIKREFDVSYDELYLSSLIHNEKLREEVLEAERAFEKEDYKGCIGLCFEALEKSVFVEGDIFYKAGSLIHYWGAAEELKKVIAKDYAEEYKRQSFYKPVKELSKAFLQLGQATTAMQFLDEYRMDWLKFWEVIDNLEIASLEELKENAKFSLNFVTNLLLKWQAEGLFKK